jgi:hypothetical protein
LFGEACNIFETRVTEQGVLLTVTAGRTEFPKARAIVCHPQTFARGGADAFDVRVHIKSLKGDNCALLTFRCGASGNESAPIEVCVGAAPVATGCFTAANAPVSMTVQEVFQ